MFKCPLCGFKNLPGSDFCESCVSDLTHSGMSYLQTDKQTRSVLENPLSTLNPKKAITIGEHETIQSAVKLMNSIHAGCLFVVNDENKLVGILTERDILTKMPEKISNCETLPVTSIMTHPVETLTPEHFIAHALNLMSMRRFRHVPVIDASEMRVISARDIVHYIASFLPSKILPQPSAKKASTVKKKKTVKVVKKKTTKKSVKKPGKKSGSKKSSKRGRSK